MPQEFHVLRCYSCETFQVHIIKKSNKWSCKMCGENQSLKKVYAKGSGKDCRIHVQSLNEKRMLNDLNPSIDNELNINNYEKDTDIDDSSLYKVEQNQSKWSEYLSEEKANQLSESECDNSEYTFERPSKRKKRSQITAKRVENERCNDNEDKIISSEDIEETINESSNFNRREEICKKESKWNSFVTNEEEDSAGFVSVTSCVSNNIFNSTDIDSLDDILDI